MANWRKHFKARPVVIKAAPDGSTVRQCYGPFYAASWDANAARLERALAEALQLAEKRVPGEFCACAMCGPADS